MGLHFRIIDSFLALAVLACALPASAGQRAAITFDPSGSVSTAPAVMNPAGVIAGVYSDSNGQHGFVRARNGSLTTVNAPGSTGSFMVHGFAL